MLPSRKIGLLCLIGLSGFLPLCAQLQLNPYLYQWRPNQELMISGADDRAERSWGAGIEALFGAANLAPLAGVSYQKRAYNLGDSGSFSVDELQLQLGIAWRLRQACTSFNLVPHLALSPGIILRTDEDSNLPDAVSEALEESLNWRLRTGFTLYLDFISLHYNWQWQLGNDVDDSTYRQLGAGIRF